MDRIQRKLWFVFPAAAFSVLLTFWLCSELGVPDPILPFSVSHLVLFVISVNFFWRLFSWIVWAILLWTAPGLLGERRLHS
jgi:hypothetical protein